jgi:hypothetical protein
MQVLVQIRKLRSIINMFGAVGRRFSHQLMQIEPHVKDRFPIQNEASKVVIMCKGAESENPLPPLPKSQQPPSQRMELDRRTRPPSFEAPFPRPSPVLLSLLASSSQAEHASLANSAPLANSAAWPRTPAGNASLSSPFSPPFSSSHGSSVLARDDGNSSGSPRTR